MIHNFCGKGYWDSGKYICNELLNYDYEIYWATTKDYKNSLPKEVHYVRFGSIKYLYHLATAKIWINNERFSIGIRKRKKQFYIQTWHGCIWFKKVEAALWNNLWYFSVLAAKNDSKMANLLVSNSEHCTKIYKTNFWYNGDILEYGCPRNDIIISNDKNSIKKVKNFFNLKISEKICLYAPTFRNYWSLDDYLNIIELEYKEIIDWLNSRFNGDRTLLIRFHPMISKLSDKLSIYSEKIINATHYPDLQELLVSVDFMITDYSSCIFDYAISKKPAMIYASDIEEYNKRERDFAIKLEDTPFPIATNSIELKNIIKNYDIKKYEKKLENFYNNIGLKETGKSCEKIAEIIKEIIDMEK